MMTIMENGFLMIPYGKNTNPKDIIQNSLIENIGKNIIGILLCFLILKS